MQIQILGVPETYSQYLNKTKESGITNNEYEHTTIKDMYLDSRIPEIYNRTIGGIWIKVNIKTARIVTS